MLDLLMTPFHWVLYSSLMACLIVPIILGLKWLFKSQMPPSWHYWIWFLLLVRLAIPLAPASSLSVLNIVPAFGDVLAKTYLLAPTGKNFTEKIGAAAVPASGITQPRVAVSGQGLTDPLSRSGQTGGKGQGEAVARPGDSRGHTMAQTMGRPVDAGQMALSALLVWLAGAMLFGLYVIFVNGRLFLRVEKTAREPQEFERELLERSKRILNLKADIRLRISPLVRMPVLFGFLRPTLLLPAGLPDQINPHELKHIFLHELVHYRQRDFLVNGLMVFLKGIYWFDPLVWYAFYLMRQDIEMACDARVLSHLDPTERSHYGYTMIHLLQIAKPQGFPGGMGILGKPSRMKRRIIMISSFKKGSAMRVALGVALLMVLGVILLTRAPNSSAESLHTSQAQGANLKSAGADSGSGSGKDGHSALGVNTQNNVVSKQVPAAPNNGIRIQSIQGQTFKGEVMLIKDPKRVKAVMTNQPGVAGERITSFVKQTGALAGINAGGFNDPNGKGNGSFPEGLTVHDGKLVYNSAGKAVVHQVIGIDSQGKLIIAPMSADELVAKHIQEAVTFYGPTLIKNGTPVIEGDGGIGIAPRTGIGQTADGTIIFVVIDGRQPTWSWGATGRDLMNVFLEYHAINAVNLDGGSSTEMVYQGKVINHLWDIFGERRVPTAFVVMPQAGKAS